MTYKSLLECINDLEKNRLLVRVKEEVDPNLEIAEIQRRAYLNQAPALYFEKVKNCQFPCVSNLFGTRERSEFIFRKTLTKVKKLISLKADPIKPLKQPWKYLNLATIGLSALPKKTKNGPILFQETNIESLPQIKSWPDDGGAFITLPQVLTLNPEDPKIMTANVGMYRVQLSGNDYLPNQEIGMHYQIHRGIGVHHAASLKKDEPLKVSIFIGGPPAHTLGAVMPLPEGLSEVMFTGAMAGRRFRYIEKDGHILSADADFCITGTIHNDTKPEGPFGDHLGYYSLAHDFPVMKIDKVYHRQNAVWPFTVVGRPPQEDTMFGELIHELTGSVVSTEIKGVKSLHAVDAAGVHPLLLSIGTERYVPYQDRRPQEILTQANAILGFGQCSLAKYLMIIAEEDNPDLDIHHIEDYLKHLLERVDWRKDLHFQTQTTMDTLDYSGTGINQGSKVVIAAAGKVKRKLSNHLPKNLKIPEPFHHPKIVLPGVMILEGPDFINDEESRNQIEALCQNEKFINNDWSELPLIIICDDSEFTSRNLNNFLWTTFTRSNPSHDIYGVKSFTEFKHWGCQGPLMIDARIKPHMAPPLIEDPKVNQRVDELATQGKSLHGIL